MTNSAIPRAPKHLRADGRRLWRQVAGMYELLPHHLAILARACESLDRLVQAREALDRDGLTTTTSFGVRAHPCVAIEKDSRIGLLRCLRELALDGETVAELNRPPQIPGRYIKGVS